MMETVAPVEVPAEFVASNVKAVAASAAVGVPEITQVEVSTERVPGNDPAFGLPTLIWQFVTAAPLLFKVVGVMAMA